MLRYEQLIFSVAEKRTQNDEELEAVRHESGEEETSERQNLP